MNKRRVLTFMICLCLSMSLLSTAAFAEGFTDADVVAPAYREAVAAMAERRVLEGYPDGSFRPEATLTREQGAKIITYLCIGKAAAEQLRCSKAPFDDVDAGRWSAPYIAWCVDHGILHGYGNGKYGPADPLTGDQYAKMLLCALGLAREGHYANGSSPWYRAVREDARKAMLYDGDPAMETSLPITRVQAALLSWNTVEAAEAAAQASPAPAQGWDNDATTPDAGIDDYPAPPAEGNSGAAASGGGGVDDNGDVLFPEAP